MNPHNPYRLLNISPEATAQEIVQASAVALRENTYSAHEIAEARQQLMHPASRRLLDFIYTVDVKPLLRDAEQGRASWADVNISDKQV
jgi:hypothetical protein